MVPNKPAPLTCPCPTPDPNTILSPPSIYHYLDATQCPTYFRNLDLTTTPNIPPHHKVPSHLNDYIFLTFQSFIPHPISSYLSYDSLSPSHITFVLSLSTMTEFASYNQAISKPRCITVTELPFILVLNP